MVDTVAPYRISDFLLTECRERGELLTNLKLQKLLYYAQAWHLALHGTAFFDEDFQAWIHGPVLPSEYQRFKNYRWRPIDGEINKPSGLGEEVEKFLTEIVDVFGSESAISLELMTHQEQPWIVARNGLPDTEPSSAIISKVSMQNFYGSINGNSKN